MCKDQVSGKRTAGTESKGKGGEHNHMPSTWASATPEDYQGQSDHSWGLTQHTNKLYLDIKHIQMERKIYLFDTNMMVKLNLK